MHGFIRKLITEHNQPVDYHLPLSDAQIHLNPLIGSKIRLSYTGNIECTHCGRATKKSFSQGYCYPCFKKLAQCDLCMMSPERCHYHLGTCREPDFGDRVCMQPHIVYLANSSGLKVGITRPNQVPTRWIDQGAVQALPLFEVSSRQMSGFVETMFKAHISDKTHWQKMLKSEGIHVDLMLAREQLLAEAKSGIDDLIEIHGEANIRLVELPDAVTIEYPVEQYPTKVKALNFEKTSVIEGVLQGIKGQYLILDIGVVNIRKFTSYEISFESLESTPNQSGFAF